MEVVRKCRYTTVFAPVWKIEQREGERERGVSKYREEG